MKKLIVVLAMAVCLLGVAGQASAATTGDIVVTVSLASVVSVSVTPGTWGIPTINSFGQQDTESFSASNNGTAAINLTITGANGVGLWTIADTPALNAFTVEASTGAPPLPGGTFFLTTGALSLNAASIGTGDSQDFNLEYTSPTANDKALGIPQGFTIVVTASAA